MSLTVNSKIPVYVGPMAGITDKIYRKILRQCGADYCFTEMVCAKALLYRNKKTFELLDITGEQEYTGVQLFGSSPTEVARAAEYAVDAGARLIDINMGCPVPKIVNNHEGSALLKDIPLAYRIIKETVAAVDVPVTVKLRKGFDGGNEGLELAKAAEAAGASGVTVHGRDRTQYYSGKADWQAIKEIKDALSIPVIANGDIFTPGDAINIIEATHADGIMVARGIQGNPWLIQDIKCVLAGKEPVPVSMEEKLEIAIGQLRENVRCYGETLGVQKMRKFLGWYLKGYRNSAAMRDKINHLTTLAEVEETLAEAEYLLQ